METKSVLYAAVGAPIVVARKVGDKVSIMKDRMEEGKATRSKAAGSVIDGWVAEGEKVVTRVSEGKVVEEISSKVDLDQAKEQVGKLRDQLEDMLVTWRTSFRPETADEKSRRERGREGPRPPRRRQRPRRPKRLPPRRQSRPQPPRRAQPRPKRLPELTYTSLSVNRFWG